MGNSDFEISMLCYTHKNLGCNDEDELCPTWKDKYGCESKVMGTECRKSCDMCPGKSFNTRQPSEEKKGSAIMLASTLADIVVDQP